MGLAILNKNLNAFGKCKICNREYNIALENILIKGIAKINGKFYIILQCSCDGDVLLEMNLDYSNTLPGCIGLERPEHPNDCSSCDVFHICKIVKGIKRYE
jgi:hypothetical protein